EVSDLALLLGFQEIIRIERRLPLAGDGGSDLAGKVVRIEGFDAACRTLSGENLLPGVIHTNAEGRKQPNTGDDDTPHRVTPCLEMAALTRPEIRPKPCRYTSRRRRP